MTEKPADMLQKLRADYWSKRLDHTLTHTQTSSRLIYFVDGAVLALVYFVIQTFGATRPLVGFASLPVFVLFLLNAMHALLIGTQAWWYHNLDAQLATILGVKQLKRATKFGTHEIYQWMHWLIAGTLAVMTSLMVAYWLGCFSDLPIRHTGEPAKLGVTGLQADAADSRPRE